MFQRLLTQLETGFTPLYLAPQAGVSESPFRRLCRRFGADVVVSEFVSAEGLRRGSEKTHEYLRFDDEERPFAEPGDTQFEFADNVRALKNAGATVITDDITFFEEPYFQHKRRAEIRARGDRAMGDVFS